MDASTATTSLSSMIGNIGSVFEAAIGWVGTIAATVGKEPILFLACVGIPLCGLGVSMFKRLLSARA